MTPEEARAKLESGATDPISVSGKLDLAGSRLETLPLGLSCYELDATGSRLTSLPADLEVESRLTLDNCHQLQELPPGLRVGALSARNCSSLSALPEGLDTWFLDLSQCSRFSHWPRSGKIRNGTVRLRNCVEMRALPAWLGPLASLDVAGCVSLQRLPEELHIVGSLDIAHTQIAALPSNLSAVALRWAGVPVSHRIALEPETLTAKDALAEGNAEIRRVIVERMGYLRFATEAGARVLSEDTDPGGKRQLLHIALDGDEPLVGLRCACPSTGREYLLRVPPTMTSCHQAAAWLAGFDDPSRYNPVIET